MSRFQEFLKRKNIVISAKRYGIDALGAMAQGLFCSLLIGTIVKTLGQQLNISFLVDIGGYASAMSGPAMAAAIGYALQAPPLVLFSLVAVGSAANGLGDAGGPLSVLIIAILACTPLVKKLGEVLQDRAASESKALTVLNVINVAGPIVLLLLSTAALVGDSYNPFLYFRF